MVKNNSEFWENKYYEGLKSLYPYSNVVSFVYKYMNKSKLKSENNVLELGFGSGNNLWFAAREGFNVSGIEWSETAVEFARNRFLNESLKGDLLKGNFTKLPFSDECFDLAIDRGALVCVDKVDQFKSIEEVKRCLVSGGYFLFTPFTECHTSMRSGGEAVEGLVKNIQSGSMTDVGDIAFLSRSDIDKFFKDGWEIVSLQRVESLDVLNIEMSMHSEWIVIARKK